MIEMIIIGAVTAVVGALVTFVKVLNKTRCESQCCDLSATIETVEPEGM